MDSTYCLDWARDLFSQNNPAQAKIAMELVC